MKKINFNTKGFKCGGGCGGGMGCWGGGGEGVGGDILSHSHLSQPVP